MDNSRRSFLRNTTLALGGLGFIQLPQLTEAANPSTPPPSLGAADDFWEWVRQSYTVTSNLINLNNGGVSPQPKVVQEVFEHYNRYSNEAPSYFMWRILDRGREDVRRDLASLCGALPEEVSICRNATEALDIAIFGIDLEKGDEVIVTNYDYPNMRHAWMQREKREGIKLVWIDIPIGEDNTEKIVQLFANAVTKKTKVIHLTHLINWTGHILPAKEICKMAREKNILTVLDAAHSFAHVAVDFHEIGCDYAGTSLHKWLCAPFGTGMLYVKKEKIAGLWPMMPNDKPQGDDIKKFESLGTRSFPAEMAVGRAIEFHLSIGMQRKEERLRFLKNYWVNKVKHHPKIKFYSPLNDHASCAIATVGIEGKTHVEIENFLLDKFQIHCVAIEWQKVNGVRITPHVYTSTRDLDRLVEGLLACAG